MKCDKCGAPVTYRENHPIGLPPRYDMSEQLKAKDEPCQKEKLWCAIEDNTWDLRCIDVPTGGDDYGVAWIIIEHYMAEPKEREIGYGNTPLEAIAQALQVKKPCSECGRIESQEISDKKTLDLVGKTFAEWQKTAILETLKLTRGRRDKAARMLKIPVRTFYRRLREFGIRKWPDPIPRNGK